MLKDDSFSVGVIIRILSILSNEGNMKRTALAGRARLQYNALMRYTKFLRKLRWVNYSPNSGYLISLTALGRNCRKLLEEEGTPSDISEEILGRLLAQAQESESKDDGALSCAFCGKIIRKRALTKELNGKTYPFDKNQCATLFGKFMDIYGQEFFHSATS